MLSFRDRLSTSIVIARQLVPRVANWWSRVCEFSHGLWVARVSTASVLLGFLLYLGAPQAQDLFLEVRGSWRDDMRLWSIFYLSVVLAWALPVFVSARWILKRYEEGPEAHPLLQPVASWVRRHVPVLLGAGCLAAVCAGQLMALYNAPVVDDPTRTFAERRGGAFYTRCLEQTGDWTFLGCRLIEFREATISYIQIFSDVVGKENFPQLFYLLLGIVLLWFFCCGWRDNCLGSYPLTEVSHLPSGLDRLGE